MKFLHWDVQINQWTRNENANVTYTRAQTEKKPLNFVAKELIKWGINGCHVGLTNITIKTSI